MDIEDLNDEVDIHIDRDKDGNYVARAYHKLSQTIKISDPCDTPEEASDNVIEGLMSLIQARREGLGN